MSFLSKVSQYKRVHTVGASFRKLELRKTSPCPWSQVSWGQWRLEDFWGAGNDLVLRLGAGYMGGSLVKLHQALPCDPALFYMHVWLQWKALLIKLWRVLKWWHDQVQTLESSCAVKKILEEGREREQRNQQGAVAFVPVRDRMARFREVTVETKRVDRLKCN